jgi:branched-chain amino acid transport system substrate-binding protein
MAGHFCSGSSIPASQVYNEEGILQISPASTNPQLTEQGFDNVFRVSGRDDEQGVIAADHVVDDQLGKRIAVVSDGSGYGDTLADAFLAELNQRGAQELLDRKIASGQTRFAGLVEQMKKLRIDLVYFGGFHTEAALLARQANERGLEIQLVSGDALATNDFWTIAGAAAAEGTLITFSPDPRKNSAAASVVEEFNDQGYDPEGYTLYTYAAIQVWAEAVEAAGTTDLASIIEQLRAGRFATVLGTVRFDHKGDVRGPSYILYRWSNGLLEEVARRVRIEVRAFVPGAFVWSGFGPCEGGVVHRGDRRIDRNGRAVFTPDSRRYMVRQLVDVVAQPSKQGFALEIGPQRRKVNPTLEYALDALADRVLTVQDDDGLRNDCHLFNQRARASAREIKVEGELVNDDVVQIYLRGSVKNPLLPKRRPALDWNLGVMIDFSLDDPAYRVEGAHDGFPAFEVYVNRELAYGFDPGAPGCTLKIATPGGARSVPSYCARQVNKVGGGLDVRVAPREGLIALGD